MGILRALGPLDDLWYSRPPLIDCGEGFRRLRYARKVARHEECIVGEGTGVHLYRDPQWGYDGCDYSGGLLLDGARQWERELSTRVGSDEKGEADLPQILRRLSWS